MRKQIEGSKAVAETVAHCHPEVIAAYPISPQTHIVEELSNLVKRDVLKGCEYINVESEFAAMSACIGASASSGGPLARREVRTSGADVTSEPADIGQPLSDDEIRSGPRTAGTAVVPRPSEHRPVAVAAERLRPPYVERLPGTQSGFAAVDPPHASPSGRRPPGSAAVLCWRRGKAERRAGLSGGG